MLRDPRHLAQSEAGGLKQERQGIASKARRTSRTFLLPRLGPGRHATGNLARLLKSEHASHRRRPGLQPIGVDASSSWNRNAKTVGGGRPTGFGGRYEATRTGLQLALGWFGAALLIATANNRLLESISLLRWADRAGKPNWSYFNRLLRPKEPPIAKSLTNALIASGGLRIFGAIVFAVLSR